MRISWIVLMVSVVGLAVVGGAAADTVVLGQTVGGAACSGNQLLVQTASTGPSYVVPAAGTVTSWSFAAGASGNQEALVILRPTGGHNYDIVGSAAPQSVAAGTTGTFATSIAVKAGDLVGEWVPAAGSNDCAAITGSSSDVLDHQFGVTSLPAAGTSVTLVAATQFRLNMSVTFSTAAAAQVNRAGYCSVAGNTTPNGTPYPAGTFLDLESNQPATDNRFKGAVPANYYQGNGISCDNLPGYTKTPELVGYGGHGDPGGYPYYTKN